MLWGCGSCCSLLAIPSSILTSPLVNSCTPTGLKKYLKSKFKLNEIAVYGYVANDIGKSVFGCNVFIFAFGRSEVILQVQK